MVSSFWMATNHGYLSCSLGPGTLLLIPCSGDKKCGHEPGQVGSICSALDHGLAEQLKHARAGIRDRAHIDETTLMPGYRRYAGELYTSGSKSIEMAVSTGRRVLIVSGGYGLLAVDEAIGMYDMRFAIRDWPRGLLESCLLDYARGASIRSAIAIMGRTTDYAKLIRKVDWKGAGITATIISPVSQGGGAMVKVPRAQGQAVEALIAGGLAEDWRSSDGLAITFERM